MNCSKRKSDGSNTSCQKSFEDMKSVLCETANLLVPHNPEAQLIISVVASPVGLGAVISHDSQGERRPIKFASQSLTPAERNYSQIDLEALAIMFGVGKFHQYLAMFKSFSCGKTTNLE